MSLCRAAARRAVWLLAALVTLGALTTGVAVGASASTAAVAATGLVTAPPSASALASSGSSSRPTTPAALGSEALIVRGLAGRAPCCQRTYAYDDVAASAAAHLVETSPTSTPDIRSNLRRHSTRGTDPSPVRLVVAAETEGGVAQLPQDMAVNPSAPDPLSLDRPVGLSDTQNEFVQGRIADLQEQGATDFRVNQQQVDINGDRVGINRPDLQYSMDGQRFYEEFDTSSSDRGPIHAGRIGANDPFGIIGSSRSSGELTPAASS